MSDILLENDPEERKPSKRRPRASIMGGIDYNPDKDILSTTQHLTGDKMRVREMDAKLVEADERGKLTVRHYPDLKAYRTSPAFKKFREASARAKVGKGTVTKRLTESGFDYGYYGDEVSSQGKTLERVDEYLPTVGGPMAKQMPLADYLSMHAKAWEAYHHHPIAKRLVRLIEQFTLGRGFSTRAFYRDAGDDKRAQAVWDRFEKANALQERIRRVENELVLYGEQFLRYTEDLHRKTLIVRQMDPSTVWEIVTAPDDIEHVYYYHTQWSTPFQLYAKHGIQSVRYIIRQVLAREVDHFKINSTSSEKRGRSELFVVIGWLKRLKDFLNDRVVLNRVRALFFYDLTVQGTEDDVNRVKEAISTLPDVGSMFFHNDRVTLTPVQSTVRAADSAEDWRALMKMIGLGFGTSEQYLGLADTVTRASALVATEPDAKNFEMYQSKVEAILMRMAERVFLHAQTTGELQKGPLPEVEFTFPEIGAGDRSVKLKDIALGETMGYISHRRASEMYSKEMNITTYDYASEQKDIAAESKQDIKVAQMYQRVPAVAPEQPQGGPPAPKPAPQPPAPKMETKEEPLYAPNIGEGDPARKRDLREAWLSGDAWMDAETVVTLFGQSGVTADALAQSVTRGTVEKRPAVGCESASWYPGDPHLYRRTNGEG